MYFFGTDEPINQGFFLLAQLVYCHRLYHRYVAGRNFKAVDLEGKVYIVTGSNTGIGFVAAKNFAEMGATVILACRNLEKAKAAREELLATVKCAPSKLIVIKLDLCGFDSVRKFVKEFRALGLPLHCLVNNAGIMNQDRLLTQDGFEMVFTANHLSHFLLTNLLLEDLEKTKGRVVVVSSSMHRHLKRFEFDNVMADKHYELFHTYSQSKLANMLFVTELQRQLNDRKSSVKAFALHPGCIQTNISHNMHPFVVFLNKMAYPILCFMLKNPEQGARCTTHVASAPDSVLMESILKDNGGIQVELGGQYFAHCVPVKPSRGSQNEADAKQLWEISETLSGLHSKSN